MWFFNCEKILLICIRFVLVYLAEYFLFFLKQNLNTLLHLGIHSKYIITVNNKTLTSLFSLRQVLYNQCFVI